MKPARVEVEIEELVLHGFAPLDRHAVAEAVQRELARLVAAGPPPARDADRLDAGSFPAPDGRDTGELGARIASSVGEVLA